jgi:hypothetical protein
MKTSQFPIEFARQVSKIHNSESTRPDFDRLKVPLTHLPIRENSISKRAGFHTIRTGWLTDAPELLINYYPGSILRSLLGRASGPRLAVQLRSFDGPIPLNVKDFSCYGENVWKDENYGKDYFLIRLASWISGVGYAVNNQNRERCQHMGIEDYHSRFFEELQTSVCTLLELSKEEENYIRYESSISLLIKEPRRAIPLASTMISEQV